MKKMIISFIALIGFTCFIVQSATAWDTNCHGPSCPEVSSGSWLWSNGSQDMANNTFAPDPATINLFGYGTEALTAEGSADKGVKVTFDGQLTQINELTKSVPVGLGTLDYSNQSIEDIWGGFKLYDDCRKGDLSINADRNYDFTGQVTDGRQMTNGVYNTSFFGSSKGKEVYLGGRLENIDTYLLTGANGLQSGFKRHLIEVDATKP